MRRHFVSPALVTALVLVFGLCSVSRGVIVNADFDPVGAGTTHVGANGALSSAGGTTWNRVDIGANKSNLVTEFNTASPVSIRFNGGSSSSHDTNSTNDIQDFTYSGGGFDIYGLLAGQQYTFVAYIGINTGFKITDANGDHLTPFSNTPTYALPGTQNSDYRRLDGLAPMNLSGGGVGFTLSTLDGTIGGWELSGVVPEPATTLGGCFVVVGVMTAARRRR
jgi:hypothetical protein